MQSFTTHQSSPARSTGVQQPLLARLSAETLGPVNHRRGYVAGRALVGLLTGTVASLVVGYGMGNLQLARVNVAAAAERDVSDVAVKPADQAKGIGQVAVPAGSKVDFNSEIRSLLSNNCFQCHGPDEHERKGSGAGLRLDTRAGATADLGGYAAIVPGKPEQSDLIQRITSTDPDVVMPPPSLGKKLTPAEIDTLQRWVAEGAPYAEHWAYVPPERVQLPSVPWSNWPAQRLDYFIGQALAREGLSPNPEADRATLARRIALDLTGLPPTRDEVQQFVTDPHPTALSDYVDRQLAKPAYGEHWARMWLDLARYADSAGYADDPARTIWAYRDYVIRAFNSNTPFDQFTIDQLAGDLLANPTEDQLIATAFHRNTLTNNEGGTSDEEFRNVAIVDRVNTTLAVWMGTSMACAQCHTHKFDPISQLDYFRFFAILNNTADADRPDESPTLPIYTKEQIQQHAEWVAELAAVQQTLETSTPELVAAQAAWEADFPRDLAWTTLIPRQQASVSGTELVWNDESQQFRVTGSPARETFTIDLALAPGTLSAIQLEALADPALPGAGPGLANGNFVLNRVSAQLAPLEASQPKARYVRLELPGDNRYLHVAEVQVLSGGENIAVRGQASQSSTDFGGLAERAIDGNTEGDYYKANSVTHTASGSNPWWEVDLTSSTAIDRVVVWNRTDGGSHVRLAGAILKLLDEQRQVVWESAITTAPEVSAELSPSSIRGVKFRDATADFTQSGFVPSDVLAATPNPAKGWAVAGAQGQNHRLILALEAPLTITEPMQLSVTLVFQSQWEQHILAAFRLAATNDSRAIEVARTPNQVLAALSKPSTDRTEAEQAELAQYYRTLAPELAAVRTRKVELDAALAGYKPTTTVPIYRELPAASQRVTKFQFRGNYQDVGDVVTPGLPTVFDFVRSPQPDRLVMAQWLVDPRNPLTARVLVNRFWETLFGNGLVRTSEEFGSQGDRPSHPELLDDLALDLIDLKWNLKAFLKQLVMSSTYRQSSRVTTEQLDRDLDNRWLGRGPRQRLAAETIRDQALAVSGLLSPKVGGPPVRPPRPSLGLSAAFGSGLDWKTSQGEDRYRRALYTEWRRTSPYPSMTTFDAPSREVCTLRRNRSNTPLQALVTLNDPVYVEAAQALGRRMLTEGGDSPAAKAKLGFELSLLREPQPHEVARLVQLFERAVTYFAEHADEAKELATDPLGPVPEGMPLADAAAWTAVANVLLNLDEFLMKP